MFTVLQRYDFESNSQPIAVPCRNAVGCLPYCKGTILKAIHNETASSPFCCAVFTVLQRYDFESNSQRHSQRFGFGFRCLPYCKGTILKAIHNWNEFNDPNGSVFTVLQRYDFESNSQQLLIRLISRRRCLPYCKGTILKAIHNWACNWKFWGNGVYRIAKVRFWKQFTTLHHYCPYKKRCLPYCKGTILKAIHNDLM